MTIEKEEIKVEGFDENQFEKADERKLIDKERSFYFAKGGTVKKFIPPFSPTYFINCDVFTPNEGSHASKEGVTDTMTRIPRPEKKWLKK